jgi:nicotinate-nucleotide adenylyltransferase
VIIDFSACKRVLDITWLQSIIGGAPRIYLQDSSGDRMLPEPMRIGIFGGTFDPVHKGHIKIAQCAKRLLKLQKVIFVVSYRPPHKEGQVRTQFSHRFKMARLAVANQPHLEVSDAEKNLRGTSYTVRTLNYFQKLYSGSHLYLIIGADSLSEISTWRNLPGILETANIITFPRRGYRVWKTEKLRRIVGAAGVRKIENGILKVRPITISSTEIRSRLAAGKSVSELVPSPVARYLRQNPEVYRLHLTRSG